MPKFKLFFCHFSKIVAGLKFWGTPRTRTHEILHGELFKVWATQKYPFFVITDRFSL